MSKKEGVRVRRARVGDKRLFLKLWTEYLNDQKLLDAGGVPPTEHNMSIFEQLFDSYVSGEYDGVVLLHAEDAVLLWGDPGGQLFESDYGRQAQGWGLYVRDHLRQKGVGEALQRKAVNILKSMQFDVVCGNIDPENKSAYEANIKFGFKPKIMLTYYDLKETK
jgi:GNAT superfamily N-acetyltransferase